MSEFKIPPISTLAGSTLKNYFKILKKGEVAPHFYFKIFLTTIIVFISSIFHIWENFTFRKKIANTNFKTPPLFILGHWRSGTTLLHNMLTKDPQAAYVTTYQSVFPNNLASKWVFKTFMRINMPDKRPSDNVKLSIDFPQEDEFAFTNSQANAYYNFFYFPKHYKQFYEESVHHHNLSEKEIEEWYSSYDRLLKKAVINTKGEQLIIKNPVNTARIDKLLKLYPDAKFLYIYRDPITVFYSTHKFFKQLFPTLWLHKIDNAFLNKMILDVYKLLMDDYLKQKHLIPAENLIELRFEEFEQNPVEEIEKIYTELLKKDFEPVKDYFTSYFKTQKKHKMNKYEVNEDELSQIRKELDQYIKLYNYDKVNSEAVKPEMEKVPNL